MPTPHPDDDWIFPDAEPPSTATAVAAPARPSGVLRIDAEGEPTSRFLRLYDATREPPLTAEAQVIGIGGCLAMSDQDNARWILTSLGAARIEQEMLGAA